MSRRHLRILLVAGALGAALLVGVLEAQDAQRRRGFSVEITTPPNQDVVFGKTKLAAKVKIDKPELVDRVEFIVGDETVFVDREPPYECFHDFGEKSKTWIVRVVAYHVEGVSVSDAVISRRLKFSTVEKVNRVILWVSASDKDGNFVTDLTKDDFRLYEKDEQQQVLDFYNEERRISLAILIDTSTSMRDKIKEVHEAAGAFVDTLREIDQALIIDFDDNVYLIQDLTSDREALKDSIASTEAFGATSIYDAIHAAYRKIGKIEGRKVIILLSDGEDTMSQFGYNRVLEEAKSNSTLIYSIALGGSFGSRKNVLKEFADVTGGKFFFVKKASDLAEVYQKIAEELGKQFFLTYSTSNDAWDGRWIKLRLESDKPGIKLRSRRGYFAVSSSMLGS